MEISILLQKRKLAYPKILQTSLQNFLGRKELFTLWTLGRVEYYEDEFGHHYLCNVYDCVYIDVFAESVEELLNLLQVMLRPDEKGWDELLDSINKDNEATIKPKDSENNSDSKQSEQEVEA